MLFPEIGGRGRESAEQALRAGKPKRCTVCAGTTGLRTQTKKVRSSANRVFCRGEAPETGLPKVVHVRENRFIVHTHGRGHGGGRGSGSGQTNVLYMHIIGHRIMFRNLKEHQKARFTRGGEKESSGGRTTKGCVGRGTNIAYPNPEQKEVLGSGGDRGFQPLSLITMSWENAQQLFKSHF